MSETNTPFPMVDGWPVFNPLTPSAFLPPEVAHQVEISKYIVIGTLGALIWDILNNIRWDYRLVVKHRVRCQTIAYFISKLASLGFILFSALYITAPLSNCSRIQKGLDVLCFVAIPSTSLLFAFRVCAVFGMKLWAIAFFGALWLAVVAGCTTILFGITGANIGPTEYCITSSVKPYMEAAAVIPMVNDTIIFCAISWRLWRNNWARPTVKNSFRVLIFGDYLPSFSKSMLLDGQAYYLITVTANVVTVATLYVASLPPPYRTMFTIPNLALMNTMACRVYRNTVFGFYKGGQSSSTMAPISLSLMASDCGKPNPGVNSSPTNISVNVATKVDSFRDSPETKEDNNPGSEMV